MPKFPNSGRRRRPNFIRGPRKNERIRAREIRLLGPDGKQIGIIQTDEARKLAKEYGLDLVEISANAKPPVCRILEYGKYMYEQSKKEKESKAKSSTTKVKEIKLRVRIEQHDYMTKLRHAEDFLFHGNKVKITLFFRGREFEHKDIGFEMINRATEDLLHIGTKDSEAKLAGRHITIMMAPIAESKRKLKLNEPHHLEERKKEEEED